MDQNKPDLRQQKFIRMTPVRKLVLRLAVPTIASMLVTALYNVADTFFVSSIGGYAGTCAIAAVSVSLSVMALIQALGFFVGQGASNFISRALGRHDVDKASEMAATGLFLALALGAAVALLGELFTAPIADFLGAKGEFTAPTVDYLRWIFAAAPLMTGSFCLWAWTRSSSIASAWARRAPLWRPRSARPWASASCWPGPSGATTSAFSSSAFAFRWKILGSLPRAACPLCCARVAAPWPSRC